MIPPRSVIDRARRALTELEEDHDVPPDILACARRLVADAEIGISPPQYIRDIVTGYIARRSRQDRYGK